MSFLTSLRAAGAVATAAAADAPGEKSMSNRPPPEDCGFGADEVAVAVGAAEGALARDAGAESAVPRRSTVGLREAGFGAGSAAEVDGAGSCTM